MTNREFLNAVVTANVSDEVTAMAQSLLAKLDERNAKRASTPSKTAIANEPIKANIVNYLSEHGLSTAGEVGEALGITTQKASALLRQIDNLTVTEVKIPKKGKVKGYTLA